MNRYIFTQGHWITDSSKNEIKQNNKKTNKILVIDPN